MPTSAEYEAARSDSIAHIASAVEIVFPAFDALPELTLRYGTREFEVDGDAYLPGLPDVPLVRQQRGPAQDTSDFQINDSKGEIYALIKPYEDVTEDARVIIKECVKTSLGIYESEIVMEGALDRFSMSESSMNVSMSAVSDMSRTGFPVGGRILAARYCAAKFNINGLRDPAEDPCGWIVELGGNPTFCSHKKEGVDGCKEHNNEPRYYALEAMSTAAVTYNSSGGFSYGGGPTQGGNTCFAPDTLIWMADGSTKPIYQIRKGDLVWSWDKQGVLRKGLVEQDLIVGLTDLSMSADFGLGRIVNCKAEHPFSINEHEYKCIGAIGVGEPVRRWDNGWKNTVFLNDWLTQKRTKMYNFPVAEFRNYIIVVDNLKLGVSNLKPVG